jgi:bifunctional N-acetylglucosamine-1-phosphate-uridyltransferase/glucosamine-1-phosphate-acetyltransferase GlmU-like protein
MSPVALILAHGQSPRLMSKTPACLHGILGDAALLWVLRSLPSAFSSALVDDGGDERIRKAVETWQQRGLLPLPCTCTSDASSALDMNTPVVVLFGDMPLLTSASIEQLALQAGAPVEAAQALVRIQSVTEGAVESRRIESRRDLAELQAAARRSINESWMDQGVTLQDPETTLVGPRVTLSADVVLESLVRLEGSTEVSSGTTIAQGSILKDCLVGENVEIKAYTIGQEARIGSGAIIGPFARLREQTVLEERVHVGNFVETKKTTLKAGAKANHLTYLGDAEVGEATNVGAGVITCNYDGFRKFRTVIGKNVFVGSDCQLIAPITIGDGVTLAAGTTVTQDVPSDALAINRAPLVIKEGGGKRLREKLRAQLAVK